MCKIGLFTACLICAGEGLPQRTPIKPPQSSPFAGSEKELPTPTDGVSNLQPFLKKREARSLAQFLLEVNPAAAFGTSVAADLRAAAWHKRRSSASRYAPTSRMETKTEELEVRAKAQGIEDEGVISTIARMEKDAASLDLAQSAEPQLAPIENIVLSIVVAVSFLSPFLSPSVEIVKILTSTMGAIAAAVGFSAEYAGKAAMWRGKEVAAIALETSAEAERLLAAAEGNKAIIPFCVAVCVSAAVIGIMAPAIVKEMLALGLNRAFRVPLFLVCPIVCVIAILVAELASQKSQVLARRAISIGLQRFAAANDFGRAPVDVAPSTITANVASLEPMKYKWRAIVIAMIWTPMVGFLAPKVFPFIPFHHIDHMAIAASALAAAQCALTLSVCEVSITEAVESVAIKRRFAAFADTYANQGMSASSVLPFTSAVCGFFAATTIAAVELVPLIGSPFGQSLLCLTGPAFGVAAAGAASISKAQCEADTNAATLAATKLSENICLEPPDPKVRLRQQMGSAARSIYRSAHRKTSNLFSHLPFTSKKQPTSNELKPAAV